MEKRPFHIKENLAESLMRQIVANEERIEAGRQKIPYHIIFELTNMCGGSCTYCYTSSTNFKSNTLPTELVFKMVDACAGMGIKLLAWHGGDPLLHPDWYRLAIYGNEKSFKNYFVLNPMTITKKVARQLVEIDSQSLVIHIDSLNQEVYNKVHSNPRTLEMKIRGYYNLLEAGYPPEKVTGCFTLTKPIIDTAEETIDWFIDEMGAPYIVLEIFRPIGFGSGQEHLEPSLADIRRVYEYKINKEGDPDLARIGTSDGGKYCCKTHFVVKCDGRVVPCLFMNNLPVDNIHNGRDLKEIFEAHREELLFDFEVKGYCGEECEDRDVCWGCRANAIHYTGDIRESDPKCWRNPNAVEYLLGIGNPK